MITSKPLPPLLPSLIITLAVLLGFANVIATSAVSTTGNHLQELYLKASELATQNQTIERTLAQKTSLQYLSLEAAKLGFVPLTKTLSLATPEPLAQLPK